jgi:NADH-quinone oxidoreductase subunit C
MTTTSAPSTPFAERLDVGATAGTTKDGIETALIAKDRWVDAARAAVEAGFVRFIDLTVVDHAGMTASDDDRFEIHLVVYSMAEKRWARMKTRTSGKLASVFSVYAGAHNYEREAFDLFGVVFEGHPRLTRIMMPDGWVGHPLRRDYEMPLEPTDFTVTRDLYKT